MIGPDGVLLIVSHPSICKPRFFMGGVAKESITKLQVLWVGLVAKR
jgi:hypothetical protein